MSLIQSRIFLPGQWGHAWWH